METDEQRDIFTTHIADSFIATKKNIVVMQSETRIIPVAKGQI